jgi:hypothetical protein
MPALLIAYDLNKEGEHYSETDKEVLNRIENYSNKKLSESSYAIATDESPNEVYNKFKDILDSNDSFYVITLSKPKRGHVFPSTTKWMDDNLD